MNYKKIPYVEKEISAIVFGTATKILFASATFIDFLFKGSKEFIFSQNQQELLPILQFPISK